MYMLNSLSYFIYQIFKFLPHNFNTDSSVGNSRVAYTGLTLLQIAFTNCGQQLFEGSQEQQKAGTN